VARQTSTGSGVYEIVNQLSQMCLDKSQDTPNANGNAVYQVTCHHTPNQQWRLIHTVDGNNSTWEWGELQNLDGNRCLDVPGANFQAGKALVVWDCNGGRNQRWNIL
jgi:endo-1,4-beta-xylanase